MKYNIETYSGQTGRSIKDWCKEHLKELLLSTLIMKVVKPILSLYNILKIIPYFLPLMQLLLCFSAHGAKLPKKSRYCWYFLVSTCLFIKKCIEVIKSERLRYTGHIKIKDDQIG